MDEMHQNVGKANGVAIRRVEADHSRDRDFLGSQDQESGNKGSPGGNLGKQKGGPHRMLTDETHRGHLALHFPGSINRQGDTQNQ